MARLEYIVWRLRNWERWRCQQASGGLGYARQAAFLNDIPGGYRESRIPVEEAEAAITDQAVEALKVPRPRVYEVLQLVYPLGLGVAATARRLGCSTSNVHALLDVGDKLIAQWLAEWSVQRRAVALPEKKSSAT